MPPPGVNLQALSAERARQLASQPGVTVMQPTHDVVYDAWAPADVRRSVAQLLLLTRRHGDGAREVALADATLARFSRNYQVFFDRLTTPAFVADDANLATVYKMIQIKGEMDDHTISADEGNRRAAEAALANISAAVARAKGGGAPPAPPARAPAAAPDTQAPDAEPRVQEL